MFTFGTGNIIIYSKVITDLSFFTSDPRPCCRDCRASVQFNDRVMARGHREASENDRRVGRVTSGFGFQRADRRAAIENASRGKPGAIWAEMRRACRSRP